MKEGIIQKSAAAVTEEELRQINTFTRREFKAEELYVFSLVLCDNEIDRDFEKFSPAALKALGELFVGKPGLFDHEPKAALQAARIFSTKVEEVPGRKTKDGEAYCRLCARAYLPRTGENDALITEIESGIKKEVSVGCSVKKRTCGLCGKPAGECTHVRGKTYGGRLCWFLLEEPTDAYEWSFVAIPAQREAGVTKRFGPGEKQGCMTLARLKQAGFGDMQLTAEEVQTMQAELDGLEKLAEAGRRLREKQMRQVVQAAAVLYPGLKGETIRRSLAVLSLEELETVAESCRKTLRNSAQPQLAAAGTAQNNEDFLI